MTIDEVIKDLKGEYSSPYNNQLAEWLEELKELREGNRTLSLGEGHFITEDNLDKSIDNAYFKGYNKAIDDCIEELKKRRDLQYMKVNCDDVELKMLSYKLKGAKRNEDFK
uniref:S26 Mitochondrial ribosome subunit S26 n=1 Tax=Siphoviridae sp. ctu9a31 TaxID=2825712 RepID=A0A8S5QAN3_9CAUD|nr:MAG TPA: S26 Mitochondrial ribosome subunit S26 [Siphoviridae sp. ctu9a31]